MDVRRTFEQWDALHEGPATDVVTALVGEFNGKYAVVSEAGKAVIYEPRRDAIMNRRYYNRMTFADLRQLYLNRRVCIGIDESGKQKYAAAADIWLRHPDRRQFLGGVVFD